MKASFIPRLVYSHFAVAGFLCLAGAGLVYGQFTQNRDNIKIDVSSLPPDIHKGYKVFHAKCNECHGLDTSLKPSMSPARWTTEIKRMQAMPSSQFNDAEANVILNFLNYDETHRKAQLKPVALPSASDSIAPGHQFYTAQSCDTCHNIAGNGGTSGPALSDVGTRLSRDQLLKVVHGMKTGDAKSSMPPLPPDTTEQQMESLVDFLVTLKN
jgi:mono/diheme cytochrome c family protein